MEREEGATISSSEPIAKRKDVISLEIKKQLWLAGPCVIINVFFSILQIISIMFVGHLGEFPLSGASMATSMAGVTGFSPMVITIAIVAKHINKKIVTYICND